MQLKHAGLFGVDEDCVELLEVEAEEDVVEAADEVVEAEDEEVVVVTFSEELAAISVFV